MSQHEAKERKETDALKAQALRLGIPIPRDPGWWWYHDDLAGMSAEAREAIGDEFEFLTEFGKSGTRKLIREELSKLKEEARKDVLWQRQHTQWKLTIAGVITGWLLGIAGILIAIFKE